MVRMTDITLVGSLVVLAAGDGWGERALFECALLDRLKLASMSSIRKALQVQALSPKRYTGLWTKAMGYGR